MGEDSNPLVPGVYDYGWVIGSVLGAVLVLSAVFSLGRRAGSLSAGIVVAWTAIVLLIPVFGPLAWFAVGRKTRAPGAFAAGATFTEGRGR